MWRALVRPLGGSGAAAGAAGRGARWLSSSPALDWLSSFVNYERKGVPAHAGMDTEEGFDLVGGWAPRSSLPRFPLTSFSGRGLLEGDVKSCG